MEHKEFVNIAEKKRMLEDRGALPEEKGDPLRDHKAMARREFSQ